MIPASTETAQPGERRRLSLFGATGSIGSSAADILRQSPDAFEIVAVTANRNADALGSLAKQLGARHAVVADLSAYSALRAALSGTGITAAAGGAALIEAAQMPADLTVAAIVGAAGLAPTMAAIEAGSDIALANKECLVSAGDLFMKAISKSGVRLLPVDSEHNAIFQALADKGVADVERIVLTASGGPFREWPQAALADATPDEAVDHPNWSMGKKVSIDSSTMMNKGLEVIEAHYLFGLRPQDIEVLIHPQSIVHGLVAYRDGSVLAQLSVPDMRVPIRNCLWWPKRHEAPHSRLDLAALGSLTFEAPDHDRFPGLAMARRALDEGGWATNVLNAANEIAVDAFLNAEIAYPDIVGLVDEVLGVAGGKSLPNKPTNLDEALEIDALGRRLARERVPARRGNLSRAQAI